MDLKKIHTSILPLRDIVVFPHMIVPLFVGRARSIHSLNYCEGTKNILLVAQKDSSLESPEENDLYQVGTFGNILQLLRLPDGTVKVLVEGLFRVNIFDMHKEKIKKEGSTDEEEVLLGHARPAIEFINDNDECISLTKAVKEQFERFTKLNRKISSDVLENLIQVEDPSKIADLVASYASIKLEEKQTLLETLDVNKRLEKVLAHIEIESGILQVEKRIRTRVRKQMEKTQRDYFLNEQLRAIHKELGDADEDVVDEFKELEKKISSTKLSKEANAKALSELKKLRQMNPASAEASVVRSYLDWLLSIPWSQKSKIKKNINEGEAILNEDHFGLEKIKERIMEYLAVQSRVSKIKGQILCLVGPPGVGKTSLGKSIARATGRSFVRIAVGGIKDESEIRGHRRTYIGSMPGRIIQGMKKAKTSNPLFLLDEIDKIGTDFRGDPASALLEVFDPEQNSAFNDHYIEVDYDLSDVMFVTTANTLNLPSALLDRMEIIRLSGYTEDEKMSIAIKYLLPKQLEAHGLKKGECVIDDSAILEIIRRYTRESGVRSLEREIAKLARKSLKQIISDKSKKSISINQSNIVDFLGTPKFDYGQIDEEDIVGVTTGLAWTEVGGDLLSIEAVSVPGKGNIKITGKLGDVMQESVQAAISYIRARSHQFGINSEVFEKKDIHVHVPEGATPKDGPSAGIAICTSVVSSLTGIPVLKDVAMTGEITLRGRVLAIGGLKEKLLAALRGGIKTVLIPKDNEKDLHDIPKNVKDNLKIVFVKTMDQVLPNALLNVPTSVPFVLENQEGISRVQ